jgi:3-dehydroquinate synthase
MHKLEIRVQPIPGRSEINVGRGILRELAQFIAESAELTPRKIALISNKKVFGLYGVDLMFSLKRSKHEVYPWLVPDGERFKSFRTLQDLVGVLGDCSFERNDLVIALGGGVVGDVAGFAASIYLRGIPLIQAPTTLLAQVDSSVGGKTGINLPVGKNLVGTFYQPSWVFIDPETLATLPRREIVSGFCEMVKQSLVASEALFERTVAALQKHNMSSDFLFSSDFEELIASHCAFKASIVMNDERESTERSDARSRRVLNFGHTTAHALEAVTNYRKFRHGEAVGYGMLVAGELSKNLGLLSAGELESLREAVALCGRLPRATEIDPAKIIRALKHDKKSVGGEISWVLLEAVGAPRIVAGKSISAKLLRQSLRAGLGQSTRSRIKFH